MLSQSLPRASVPGLAVSGTAIHLLHRNGLSDQCLNHAGVALTDMQTEGLSTIRAFGWQDNYAEKNIQSLDASQRPFYYLTCVQRWLQVVLDLLIAAIAITVVLLTVISRDNNKGANIGIALNMVIAANATLLRLISSWTSLELAIGAVTRLKEVQDTTPREDLDVETFFPAESWPSRGALALKNVQVSYKYVIFWATPPTLLTCEVVSIPSLCVTWIFASSLDRRFSFAVELEGLSLSIQL